jgi:hypothetical protein
VAGGFSRHHHRGNIALLLENVGISAIWECYGAPASLTNRPVVRKARSRSAQSEGEATVFAGATQSVKMEA